MQTLSLLKLTLADKSRMIQIRNEKKVFVLKMMRINWANGFGLFIVPEVPTVLLQHQGLPLLWLQYLCCELNWLFSNNLLPAAQTSYISNFSEY